MFRKDAFELTQRSQKAIPLKTSQERAKQQQQKQKDGESNRAIKKIYNNLPCFSPLSF